MLGFLARYEGEGVIELVHDPQQTAALLQAANVLQLPELFVLCLGQLYKQRGSDPALLRQIVPQSFFGSVSADAVVRTHAALAQGGRELALDHFAVLNQYWEGAVKTHFGDRLQAHMAFRRGLGTSPTWLALFAELKAQQSMVDMTAQGSLSRLDAGLWGQPLFSHSVEAVDASYTDISPDAVLMLTSACPRLAMLDVSGTSVDDQAVQQLVRACTQLRWLGISGARVSRRTGQSLQQQFGLRLTVLQE